MADRISALPPNTFLRNDLHGRFVADHAAKRSRQHVDKAECVYTLDRQAGQVH